MTETETQPTATEEVPKRPRYYRKVIRIRGEDSPNVRYALAQQRAGMEPDDTVIVPGVLTWGDYKKRRSTWDEIQQCVCLDAKFYEGKDVKLFPREVLDRAKLLGEGLYNVRRKGKAIGIDPAEGGDKTTWSVIDELGLIELVSKHTPNTAHIQEETLSLMRQYNIPPEYVVFDRGGGGKQHADYMREAGYGVRTVAFGETIVQEPKHGQVQVEEKVENREERYTFKNRRAQMYGELSILMDSFNTEGFAIPPQEKELLRQLSLIPKTYDGEGRLYLLPKSKKNPESTERTLIDIIGNSPDEADSLVLAVFGLYHPAEVPTAGAGF